MTATTTPPRVIGPQPARARRMPEGWLRSTITGVEAAVLSWLTVVVPAVAAYVATAAAPVLGDASWVEAARTGTALWLLGQGGVRPLGGGAALTLAPLGLSLLSLTLVYGGARRARLRGWGPAGFTVAGHVAMTLVLSLLVTGPAGRPGAALGAAVIAALGTGAALRRADVPAPRLRAALARVPEPVRAGTRAATWAGLGLAIAAVLAAGLAIAVGWPQVVDLHRALAPDVVGAVALVLGQLLWLPTAVVWALGWLAGPGFVVGTGTDFAPGEVVAAPLPAVPLLGALPGPGGPDLTWVVLVPVLVGALTGWRLHRRRFQPHPGSAVLAAALAGAGAGVLAGVAALVARGSIGPGRMAVVGAAPPAVVGAVALEVALGAVLVVLLAHPWSRATVLRGFRGARGRVTAAGESRRARRDEARADAENHADASTDADASTHADATTAPEAPRRAAPMWHRLRPGSREDASGHQAS
ncbi:DUF6350 family protein [Georgenia faecalis]|uniref:cell division protein PerM n=1 Tax=Georgenia faecalis TaxID=2483799 RepID=UPI000FD95B43|nr:DUF6350 family protein [Georgenia faecalis]